MAEQKKKKRSLCPCSCALDILGDKWTLLIIRDITLRHKSTYGDFLTSEEQIATNILANRLARMVDEKILLKKKYSKDKRRDQYTLTSKGLDLIPLFIEVMYWGSCHGGETNAPQNFITSISEDRTHMAKKIRMSYEEAFSLE